MFAEVLLREYALNLDVQWSRVEYREPDKCGCSIQERLIAAGLVPHDGSERARRLRDLYADAFAHEIGVDSPGSTMCCNCRESWSWDHFVRGPWN